MTPPRWQRGQEYNVLKASMDLSTLISWGMTDSRSIQKCGISPVAVHGLGSGISREIQARYPIISSGSKRLLSASGVAYKRNMREGWGRQSETSV